MAEMLVELEGGVAKVRPGGSIGLEAVPLSGLFQFRTRVESCFALA